MIIGNPSRTKQQSVIIFSHFICVRANMAISLQHFFKYTLRQIRLKKTTPISINMDTEYVIHTRWLVRRYYIMYK